MVKNYFEQTKVHTNFFLYHNISRAFHKIESGFCIFLCLVLLITSKVNKNLTDTVTMNIVHFSMPIVRVVSWPLNLLVGVATNFQDLVDAKNRNIDLAKENEKLKSLYIKSLNINQENKQLREIVKYAGLRSSKYTVARLIARPYQMYSRNVFIDSGSRQEIKEGNIVTGNNALVGRITQVDQKTSRVLLATDINSRIPVITSGARTKGILAGNNNDVMEILYLEKDHHIEVGDMVFTSGDGDAIPPGILVGVVTAIDKGYAAVEMVEDVRNLDMVSVLEY